MKKKRIKKLKNSFDRRIDTIIEGKDENEEK
jgi:hypothetical protein